MDISAILEIKKQLKQPYSRDINGEKHHFEVGHQVHTSNYYHDKHYFQNLEHSHLVAELLVAKLGEAPFNIDQVTLLGCTSYCGHFLSETVSLLKERRVAATGKEPDINYALLDTSGPEMSFLFTPEFNKYVIIVSPLTCTYSTCFEIERFLQREAPKFLREGRKQDDSPKALTIIPDFIAVFLSSDSMLKIGKLEKGKANLISDLSRKRKKKFHHLDQTIALYELFGWHAIREGKITFIDKAPYKDHSGSYLINVDSNLFLGEKCQYCFPDLPEKEKALFPTRNNFDPNLIFDLPQFKNTDGCIATEDFDRVLGAHNDFGHLFGHLRVNNNSFLHYIERDVFYENNKPAIIGFFRKQINILLPELNDPKVSLLIITPVHYKSSRILEDLIREGLFSRERTTVINTDPNNEFVENFLNNNEGELKRSSRIIFFDHIMSGGKNFKMVGDYLSYARGESHGFDAILTVVDRTTAYSKKEILRKLNPRARNAGRFIAFFKLNLPLVDSANSGNPVEGKIDKLYQIFNFCHLDSLKRLIKDKISKGRPLGLTELKQKNLLYPPEIRKRYLLKLRISHELSNCFYDFTQQLPLLRKPGVPQFSYNDLLEIISAVCNKVKTDETAAETEYVTELIIKILTNSPFKFYEGIYFTSFEFVRNKLISLTGELRKNDYLLSGQEKLKRLNFYLKRSVDLNSNFMFSRDFLTTLKGIFENPANNNGDLLVDMSNFLLFYKELTFRNPSRSIRLEELLDSPEFWPKPLLQPDIDIYATLSDRFFLMGRLLKSENSYLLNDLKELFLKEIDDNIVPEDRSVGLNEVKNYIQKYYLSPSADRTNKTIRNAQDFFRRSREMQVYPPEGAGALPVGISRSFLEMLTTIYRLKKTKIRRLNFLNDVKLILRNACDIIAPDLDFAFCIEYKERDLSSGGRLEDDYENADNIYTILSDEENDLDRIRKDGLIYQMLYGLNEFKGRNLQTFIAVVRDQEGKIASFRNTYYPSDTDHPSRNSAAVVINNAFRNDLRSGESGVIHKDARMVLLFRLAELEIEDDDLHKGEAVLVISSKEPATTANFTRFINVEKVRLLLTIKAPMLEYLKKQFENDAFIDLMNDKRKLRYKSSMEHMLSNYFSAMESTWESSGELKDVDKQLLNFLHNKIQRIMLSISEGDKWGYDEIGKSSKQFYAPEKLRALYDTLMTAPYLARLPLLNGVDCKVDFEVTESIECEPVIFEQVIPEIIINMRRYAIDSVESPKYFRVEFAGEQLVFENPFNNKMNPTPQKLKSNGGKKMCNNILRKYNMYPLKDEVIDKDRYRTVLNLKNRTDE